MELRKERPHHLIVTIGGKKQQEQRVDFNCKNK
jgi:hypothetical protein